MAPEIAALGVSTAQTEIARDRRKPHGMMHNIM
jgi:hypothetical protein